MIDYIIVIITYFFYYQEKLKYNDAIRIRLKIKIK